MTDTFNDVKIDGIADVTQLTVEGHTTQTQPLQTWQTSAGSSLGQITGDGRLAIGDDLGGATPDSLVEVHRADTSTAKPKRGFHSLGRISGALSEAVNWSVHELELLGNGIISTLQTALRVRLSSSNSATSSSAELRAADIESNNQAGTVGKATALQATVKSQNTATVTEARGVSVKVEKDSGATIGTAYGIKVDDVSAGTNNYALHTGVGIAHIGDTLELKAPPTTPANPASGETRVYHGSDGILYGRNSGGEYALGNPILLGSVSLSATANNMSATFPANPQCTHLELIVLARTTLAGAIGEWVRLYYNGDTTNTNYSMSYLYGGSPLASNGSLANDAFAVVASSANALANHFAIARIFIPFYQGSSHQKIASCTVNARYDATNIYSYHITHLWKAAAGTGDITSVRLQPAGASSLFVAGSKLQVLGYKL